ncbi:MAG: universal stress protein [Gammaproteobacteria bacterium]
MKSYQHILLAVDLHSECDKITIERVASLAEAYNAEVSLVHAVEHIHAYGIAQAYPAVLNFEEEMQRIAQEELSKLGSQIGIPVARQFVEFGSPKAVILDKAMDIKADLIVVGSHGRHGISLLLGSTANTILHHAHCDVLAVRVSD